MFETIKGDCYVAVPVEYVQYSTTYINSTEYIAVEMIGKCPRCGKTIGERQYFKYVDTERMTEKEIELFNQSPIVTD